jgi:hypothetical protein
MLRHSGMLDAIGAENFFTMGDDAMAAIKTRLNPTTCANCTVRDDAHIATGTRLEVRYVGGEIRLRPLADCTATGLAQVAGCLYRPERQRLSDADTQAAIRAKLKARNAA